MTVAEAYAALGLDGARASETAVRARFRDLIRAHHPDRAPAEEQVHANAVTRTLVEAYAFLRDRNFPRENELHDDEPAWYGEPAWYDEPEAYAATATADRYAWVEELWRESVLRGPPQRAIAGAIVRGVVWCLGSVALLGIGMVAVIGGVLTGDWIVAGLGAVGTVFAIRLAAAAGRIAREVRRFTAVWPRAGDGSTFRR